MIVGRETVVNRLFLYSKLTFYVCGISIFVHFLLFFIAMSMVIPISNSYKQDSVKINDANIRLKEVMKIQEERAHILAKMSYDIEIINAKLKLIYDRMENENIKNK